MYMYVYTYMCIYLYIKIGCSGEEESILFIVIEELRGDMTGEMVQPFRALAVLAAFISQHHGDS